MNKDKTNIVGNVSYVDIDLDVAFTQVLVCFCFLIYSFVHMYIFFRLFSHEGYYKILSIVPCAV